MFLEVIREENRAHEGCFVHVCAYANCCAASDEVFGCSDVAYCAGPVEGGVALVVYGSVDLECWWGDRGGDGAVGVVAFEHEVVEDLAGVFDVIAFALVEVDVCGCCLGLL